MPSPSKRSRRAFLHTATGFAAGFALGRNATTAQDPELKQGIQIGDVHEHGAVIWSRSSRPSRLVVEYSFDQAFRRSKTVEGPVALAGSDFTARTDLSGLPSGHEVFVRARFVDLRNGSRVSDPTEGRFSTAPNTKKNVRFLFSGDTAGQGWGINPDIGGMRIYESMRRTNPDFFVHCGDTIYADGPIPKSQTTEAGKEWRNIVTPEVSKVAETLDEFRGRYRYNLLDKNIRRFSAEVPQIWQWDDHEVVNNWSSGKDLSSDKRYREKNVSRLIEHGTRAFLDYSPMRFPLSRALERIYRKVSYGPDLDLFVVDKRSYRGPNSFNRQPKASKETRFFGRDQLEWLKSGLAASPKTWKVIASDMPLGLRVGDGRDREGRPRWENAANGDGPALGRELEIAELLGFIKKRNIQNIVWVTADVHYTAAHFYDPQKAQFRDFLPFWEFVS
ncbi:MAG: alkaline phosphatase D family protein, partial [Planctomycetota bacterium]